MTMFLIRRKSGSLINEKSGAITAKNFGHFAKECWKGVGAKNKSKNQANLAQDESSDLEIVMLMARTHEDDVEGVSWYLDSVCSTHMMGRKEWFVDDRSLTVEGSDRVVLHDDNGKEVVIE